MCVKKNTKKYKHFPSGHFPRETKPATQNKNLFKPKKNQKHF